jgi:protein-S-isoprenylcysteine O-methyltransferase Ste14
MTRHALSSQPHPHETHVLTAFASLTVGALFFAFWFWLLPPILGFQVDGTGLAGLRWLAAAPSILGFGVALRCVWDFGWTGRGTPAPMAPPKNLVVVGFYRYVRNPMYLGFISGWAGLWIVFGRANWPALSLTALIILGVLTFVLLYEEPHLRQTFGLDYEEYCRNVPRWIPRLHPWEQ